MEILSAFFDISTDIEVLSVYLEGENFRIRKNVADFSVNIGTFLRGILFLRSGTTFKTLLHIHIFRTRKMQKQKMLINQKNPLLFCSDLKL